MDFGGGIRKLNAGVGKKDKNKKHIKMEEPDRKKIVLYQTQRN